MGYHTQIFQVVHLGIHIKFPFPNLGPFLSKISGPESLSFQFHAFIIVQIAGTVCLHGICFWFQLAVASHSGIGLMTVKVKVKRYSSSWQVISELRDVTCPMRSHSVTFHPTQLNSPRLTSARQAGTQFTYPGGMEGWVDLWWQMMLTSMLKYYLKM